jgi:SAM-dependent methyltransferase
MKLSSLFARNPAADSLDTARDLWSKQADPKELARRQYDSWMNHPVIAAGYINKKFGGGAERNWLNYVAEKYAPAPAARACSLGCGAGGLERHALSLNIAQHFDAYDIASGAIEVAGREAAAIGFGDRTTYEVCNLNNIELAPNAYDMVFACQSAHHFESLEHIFAQVARSLKSGGLFILNEFVGPTRFQWTDKQMSIANRLLNALPDHYRRSVTMPGVQKNSIERPTIAQMIAIDPTEAIRASELLPILQQRFEIVERIDFGGTLLHILLQDIVGNFDPTSPHDALVLRLLWEYEDTLIANKVIESDFAFLVAKRR